MAITSRPITPDDDEFLCALYASTRTEELAHVPWSDEEKRDFLRMQHRAQHLHYMRAYAGDEFSLILDSGRPIGRLYVGRWSDEIRIIDIALLPEHRGRGLGSQLLRGVFDEAREAGKPVRIHVEKTNPAMRLYRRLGFVRVEDRGVYDLMEWRPGESVS